MENLSRNQRKKGRKRVVAERGSGRNHPWTKNKGRSFIIRIPSGKMLNWTDFCKQYKNKHGLTYGQSLTQAGPAWRAYTAAMKEAGEIPEKKKRSHDKPKKQAAAAAMEEDDDSDDADSSPSSPSHAGPFRGLAS